MVVTAIASRGSRFQMSAGNLWKPQHNTTTDEFRALFEDAGFTVTASIEFRGRGGLSPLFDVITAGTKLIYRRMASQRIVGGIPAQPRFTRG